MFVLAEERDRMSETWYSLPPSPETSDHEEEPAAEDPVKAPARILAYADDWLPISQSRSRVQGEEGDALVDQEAVPGPSAGSDSDQLGLECLFGDGDDGPPTPQLDAVTEALTGVSESSKSPDGDERILDIRVRDWGPAVLFARIERPLEAEEKQRLREQAYLALSTLEDLPVDMTSAEKRGHLLQALAITPRPFEGYEDVDSDSQLEPEELDSEAEVDDEEDEPVTDSIYDFVCSENYEVTVVAVDEASPPENGGTRGEFQVVYEFLMGLPALWSAREKERIARHAFGYPPLALSSDEEETEGTDEESGISSAEEGKSSEKEVE